MLLLFFVSNALNAQIVLSVSDNETKIVTLIPVRQNDMNKEQTYHFSQWINYTTLVNYLEPSFSVNLEMRAKKLPLDSKIIVEMLPYKGLSELENVGTSAIGNKTLSQKAITLVDEIPTSYSGSNPGEGHRCNISFIYPMKVNADTTNYQIELIYTINQ